MFEFKVVEGAEPKAIKQISSKRYQERYTFQGDIPDSNRFQC
ncbi:MAG: hypothetical protein NZ927_09800 [Candidatus Calescibacterium sp.]|nr:hypothetical protein [Candidatus Calescibacterium sp.]